MSEIKTEVRTSRVEMSCPGKECAGTMNYTGKDKSTPQKLHICTVCYSKAFYPKEYPYYEYESLDGLSVLAMEDTNAYDAIPPFKDPFRCVVSQDWSISDILSVIKIDADRLCALLELEYIAKHLNGGWEPDWSDGHMTKWLIVQREGKFVPDNWDTDRVTAVYFKSESLCLEAIKILGSVKLGLLFGVKKKD